MAEEKAVNNNKILVAIAIFFVIGFIINTAITYNDSTYIKQDASVGTELLEAVRVNGNKAEEGVRKLDEINKKLDDINGRVQILEDNSKKVK